jgi:hypothetical protein
VCNFDEGWRAGLSIERGVVMKAAKVRRSSLFPIFIQSNISFSWIYHPPILIYLMKP